MMPVITTCLNPERVNTALQQANVVIPLGIKFYYAGNEDWPADCPNFGPEAEQGCFGCGWYDFVAWREALNRYIDDEE